MSGTEAAIELALVFGGFFALAVARTLRDPNEFGGGWAILAALIEWVTWTAMFILAIRLAKFVWSF